MGLAAHRDTIDLFRKAAKEARDPDVRAFAAKTLPALQGHLDMAHKLPAAGATAARAAAGPDRQELRQVLPLRRAAARPGLRHAAGWRRACGLPQRCMTHDHDTPRPTGAPMAPGDEAPPGSPGTGEAPCRACGGTGRLGGQACTSCQGTGKVNVGIGGG